MPGKRVAIVELSAHLGGRIRFRVERVVVADASLGENEQYGLGPRGARGASCWRRESGGEGKPEGAQRAGLEQAAAAIPSLVLVALADSRRISV